MTQYLSDIKSKVDLIVAVGSPLDTEDIIYYTLNGLSPLYQGFKVSICTNLQSISLDDLYSLLCTEETILESEATKLNSGTQTIALAAGRGKTVYWSSLCGRAS